MSSCVDRNQGNMVVVEIIKDSTNFSGWNLWGSKWDQNQFWCWLHLSWKHGRPPLSHFTRAKFSKHGSKFGGSYPPPLRPPLNPKIWWWVRFCLKISGRNLVFTDVKHKCMQSSVTKVTRSIRVTLVGSTNTMI